MNEVSEVSQCRNWEAPYLICHLLVGIAKADTHTHTPENYTAAEREHCVAFCGRFSKSQILKLYGTLVQTKLLGETKLGLRIVDLSVIQSVCDDKAIYNQTVITDSDLSAALY